MRDVSTSLDMTRTFCVRRRSPGINITVDLMPRKKSRRSQLVVLDGDGARADRRVALPPSERRLTFGERWSYAPAPEASDYIKIRPRYKLFIGGKFVAPRSGKYFDSINPATDEKQAKIAAAGEEAVAAAGSAAGRAY